MSAVILGLCFLIRGIHAFASILSMTSPRYQLVQSTACIFRVTALVEEVSYLVWISGSRAGDQMIGLDMSPLANRTSRDT